MLTKPRMLSSVRWYLRVLLALLGIGVGLGVAEAAFYARDDGAFPHANFYVPDDSLGVRLEPGATERLALPPNPVTSIRVNTHGYRGGEWPERSDDEILVVGDSQVFGLGVEEDETFSAKLAELTGRTVVNGGVPTYGPLEYNAVAREIATERRPKTIVYVVNFVNDLFENERPNTERHAEWDGWAVRRETAPASTIDFPMRRTLFQRSHLVYALRRLLHREDAQPDERFASEGTFTDLVQLGGASSNAHVEAERLAQEQEAQRRSRLLAARETIATSNERITTLAQEQRRHGAWGYQLFLIEDVANGNPGDIVQERYVEESSAITLTADLIREAIALRERLLATHQRYEAESARVTAARESAENEQDSIERADAPQPTVASVLEPRLAEAKAIADQIGAELVVVALPIDVQVSSAEWQKYDAPEIDMSASRVLLADLVASAHRLRVRALDATEALAAAEPGAFLDRDIHMTAKGHAALARAIAATMGEPLPLAVPSLSLPAERSRAPSYEEWAHAGEMEITGGNRHRCEAHRVREWTRIVCKRTRRDRPNAVEVRVDPHHEAMAIVTADSATLLAPVLSGETFRAELYWETDGQVLVIDGPAGGAPGPRIEGAPLPGRPFTAPSAEVARLCECHAQVTEEQRCQVLYGWTDPDRCRPACTSLTGAPRPECFAAYREDCAQLLACVRGDAIALPTCAEGQAPALATLECRPLCDDAHRCTEGECTPWGGAGVCL